MDNRASAKNVRLRSFWALFVLMMVVVGVISVFAVYTIRNAAENLNANLQLTLGANAQTEASDIASWIDNAQINTSRFVEKDMLRLFSAESLLSKRDDPNMSNQEDRRRLKNMWPLITQQLEQFVAENDFVSSELWDADLERLLDSETQQKSNIEEEKQALLAAIQTGVAQITPVYDSPQGLVLSIAQPILPPAYTDMPSDTPVAVLLVHVSLKKTISPLINTRPGEDSRRTRLIQWKGDSSNILQEIAIDESALLDLPGWEAQPNTTLALMERDLPEGRSVYVMGIPVRGQSFLVSSEVDSIVAETAYENLRKGMIYIVVSIIGLTIAILGVLWWLLMGRDERAMVARLSTLYQDTVKQQQFLDGINGALADGVVLTNSQGRIQYANTAFADMVRHTQASLKELTLSSLLDHQAIEILTESLQATVDTGEAQTCRIAMTREESIRYAEIVSSPFYDEEKTVVGTVCVYRDITEALLASEAEQARINQVVHVLTAAIEIVNPYLCGQSAFMGRLAQSIAGKMGLGSDEQKNLTTAAALSQIGMLQLPKELLNKEGALTLEERKRMETHITHAQTLLADFDFGFPVQETILQMYENLDGTGYPHQLKGDEIILSARILNVANAFCAILRPRSYRKAKTLDEAFSILTSNNSRYDDRVLGALQDFVKGPEGMEFVSALQGRTLNEGDSV